MSMIEDFDPELLNKASLVWFDIQQLRTDSLGENEFIYPPDRKPSPNNPTLGEIKVILAAFQDEGAIKDIKPIGYGRRNNPSRWSIQIDSHYFKELGKKIKALYLSKPQEELDKQISEQAVHYTPGLGDIADQRMEKFFEDEIQLISKLLQICNDRTQSVVLMHPASIAESDPDKAGFDYLETLETLQKKYAVFTKFTPSLLKKLPHTLVTVARINFSKLIARAESLHDDVETWKGKVYGIEQQKKIMLSRLMDYIRKSPHENDEPYEYSERILGTYTPRIESKPIGQSLLNPDPNRIDIKFQFMRAMRELERDGHIEILDVNFEFDAQPRPTKDSEEAHKLSLGERSLVFYPARHCHVTLRLKTKASDVTELRWNDLSLNVNNGWGKFNGKQHRFKPSLPHFKVLKTLLEANGEPVTYLQFFESVNPELKNDEKSGKEFIRQKVRDIRKYFGVNRRKNPESDIFYDTGGGFQLKHLR